jgi:AraC-like DNA-binding protein
MTEHSVLATFLLPIAQALRLHGLDAMAVIDGLGIDAASSINPDRRIPAPAMQRLWSHCVELTGDEAFGLLAAEQVQPQVLHGLGLAWLASDSLYDGLKRTVRFSKIMNTGVEPKLLESDDLVEVVVAPPVQVDDFAFASRDFAVGVIVRMCRLTLGEFIAPLYIHLDRPPPGEPERWEYMLASRVLFGCDATRIAFVRADITERLATGDPALARVNDEHVQDYLDNYLDNSITRDVVHQIVQKLPDGPPSQQQIADALHVSNRTLQRRLKSEGTSFMDLLQDTRLQLARKYLRQRNRSVVETAYMLGFSEPSTFSRAFKRWTGRAPAEYREYPESS